MKKEVHSNLSDNAEHGGHENHPGSAGVVALLLQEVVYAPVDTVHSLTHVPESLAVVGVALVSRPRESVDPGFNLGEACLHDGQASDLLSLLRVRGVSLP